MEPNQDPQNPDQQPPAPNPQPQAPPAVEPPAPNPTSPPPAPAPEPNPPNPAPPPAQPQPPATQPTQPQPAQPVPPTTNPLDPTATVQQSQSFETAQKKSVNKPLLIGLGVFGVVFLVLLLVLVPMLIGGDDEQSAKNDWSEQTRSTYYDGCVGSASASSATEEEVATYCQCTLDGLQAEYTETEFAQVEEDLLRTGLDGNPTVEGIIDRCLAAIQ